MEAERFSLEKNRWSSLFRAFTDGPSITAATPRQALWKRNKATLWYYPAPVKRYQTPLYLIYSLVNQATILDLLPNTSLIGALTNAGYEVYLIDFGIPRYEDRDMTIDDYVLKYIQSGARIALKHSNSNSISLMGFCLGGTLAAIYAAIAKEPIENLILFVTPVDFSHFPKFDLLHQAIKDKTIDLSPLIDSLGIMPATFIHYGVRLITSPVYISPYLSLLVKGHNKEYAHKWSLFNQWTKEHIPFPGAALKQMVNELIIHNKLVTGKFTIGGKPARLQQILSNLLVIASTNDELVPIEQALPMMTLVGSEDKELIQLPNGHTGIASGAGLPTTLFHWLASRSHPLLIESEEGNLDWK
ncbi:alpha/beta fold hydrolase [Robertmurraya korlensis]|uniref:alpha/beta fold hydrolase n=1 Tax=Robertmurraya korlensis TaxID=519977 RepID=UPI00203E6F14|nr:alpha/beta fold hydrolase [Robertmurraya korlensis]MCM3600590.1 alpha/beta fold hydrolase [Robertmurraya korlensis]